MTASLRALAERAARELGTKAIGDASRHDGRDYRYQLAPSKDEIADAIERVARQAVEAEREACARLVSAHFDACDESNPAERIRARGGKA